MTAAEEDQTASGSASRWRRVVHHPAFGFVVVATVFVVLRVVAVWGRAPELFPDSATYRVPDEGSPYDILDLTGNAPRAWVLPLLYRVLPNDTVRITVQVLISMAAWLGLAGVLVSLLRTSVAQWVAFVSVLALAVTPQVTTWDIAVLSESLTVSLAVGSVAAWILVLCRPGPATAAITVGLTGLWVLIRPLQFPLALLAIVVCLIWVIRPDRRVLKGAMAAALGVVLAWSVFMSPRINEAYRRRDGYGVAYVAEVFGQNFFKRYLADPEAEAWFRARGMPDDEDLSGPSRYPGSRTDDYDAWLVYFAELRERDDWMDYLENQAQSDVFAYVRSHPTEVLAEFADEVPVMLRAYSNPAYGEPVDTLPGPADRTFFWGSNHSLVRGDWGLWTLICVVLAALAAWRRARPAWVLVGSGLVVIALSWALLFQVWLGSAYEKVRHSVPSTYLLRVGLIVVAVALLDALVLHWRRAPSAEARVPTTEG